MEYGEKIKEIRRIKNLNQVEFANLIDIGVATLSAYETGRTTPNIDFLRRLSEKCGVSPSWFLGIEEQKAPKTYGDILDIVLILEDLNCAKTTPSFWSPRLGKSVNLAVLCFADEKLVKILADYKKIRKLYLDKTIPEDLYLTWIRQKRDELSKIHTEANKEDKIVIHEIENFNYTSFSAQEEF